MRGDLIDAEATISLVEQHPNIRLLLVQPSHCRRPQPIDELGERTPERVTLAVDVSHTAGLIAAGLLPAASPAGSGHPHVQHAQDGAGAEQGRHRLRRPRPSAGAHDVGHHCPQLQSNSHAECLPGLVITLEEIANFGRAYAEQVVANARTLAQVLDRNGLNVPGMEYGGTQTHQVHVHLGTADAANRVANELLPSCGIRTNSVLIPGTGGEFGLRLGTQALTRRGLTEVEFSRLGRLLARALKWNADQGRIRQEVAELLANYPLFPLRFSFDQPPMASTSSGC